MSGGGGSVTLIFYKLPDRWWAEPLLNVISAAAQGSRFTHVELAIGSAPGENGMLTNVSRIYNDDAGVELVSRTGRNPQYVYSQLGCSAEAEAAMLRYAKSLVGVPFSNTAMARSLIWPRQTDGTSFFCAELVAAVLQRGGLMSKSSNPGAATPESLHAMYSKRAATHANPHVLRDISRLTSASLCSAPSSSVESEAERKQRRSEQQARLVSKAIADARGAAKLGNLYVISQRSRDTVPAGGLTLSLTSLDMRRVASPRH